MSLIRIVTRICAVAALREMTWAEDRVYDSDNTPLAEALLNQAAAPYITVYTDEDHRSEITGKEIYSSMRGIALVLEIGVASATQQEGEGGVVLKIPATDEGMELAVDIVEAQALSALLGNTRSEFGEILRDIVLKVTRIPSVRGGSAERGTRWAARQVKLVLDVISDHPAGVPLPIDHPILRFIEVGKLSDISRVADAARVVESMVSNAAYPSWEQAQAWLGLSGKSFRSTGIAPLLQQDMDEHVEAPTIADEEDVGIHPEEET